MRTSAFALFNRQASQPRGMPMGPASALLPAPNAEQKPITFPSAAIHPPMTTLVRSLPVCGQQVGRDREGSEHHAERERRANAAARQAEWLVSSGWMFIFHLPSPIYPES